MDDSIRYTQLYLNTSNRMPAQQCPSRGSSPIYLWLLLASLAAIAWLRAKLQLPQLGWDPPDQIPAAAEDADEAEVAAPAMPLARTPPRAELYHAGGVCSTSGNHHDDDDQEAAGGHGHSVAVTINGIIRRGTGGAAAFVDEIQRQAFLRGTIHRSGEAAGILNRLVNALGQILLDIHSSDESTIHPANGLLIEALESTHATGDYTIESYSGVFDCWASKLWEDAERIWQGEKGRQNIFLLNNTYDVWQIMRRPGASFLVAEAVITSMIGQYKKSYFDECWVPLNSIHRLDKFTAEFLIMCSRQMTWKVTAELKYNLRQEIVDFIVPTYEASLFAQQGNGCRLSGVLHWLKRVMAGKKKQKKYTSEELEMVIRELYEGELQANGSEKNLCCKYRSILLE